MRQVNICWLDYKTFKEVILYKDAVYRFGISNIEKQYEQ